MATRVLRPGSIGSYSQWATSSGNKVNDVDTGDPVVHNDGSNFIAANVDNDKQTFKWLASSIPSGTITVNSLTLWVRIGGGARGAYWSAFWRLSGVDTNVGPSPWAYAGMPWTNYSNVLAKTPQFTTADLLAMEVGVKQVPGDYFEVQCTSIWGILDFSDSTQIESAREIGSRRLRVRRLANGLIEVVVPSLEYVDQELIDLVGLSHPELPAVDGLGAGVKPWQRWPCVKVRSELRWESGSEVMQLRDLRDILCTYWDVGKSLKAGAATLDGLARLTSASRSWQHTNAAYAVAPSGDRLVTVGVNIEKLDKDGLLIEASSANEIIQSGFKNGAFTGWTVSGSGTIVADTSDLLFESTITAQSAKLTASATISTDLQALSTATRSFSANAVVRASIWHKDDSGNALSYAIQRAFDSKWWQDSDQTWQASKIWNPLAVTATRARHKSKQINVGANATTLSIAVGVPTTGVGGQVNHCYHVQIEEKKFVSSAIFTEAAVVTRATDFLTLSNYSQSPTWPPDRGLFRCYVVPEWDAADVAGVNKTLFFVPHDSANYDWLYFDGTNGRWVFERCAAGVTYRAVKTHSPVAGSTYKLAARWTSDLLEQNLPARTISLFIDGVKGTDATAAALQIQTASTIEQGSKNSAEYFDGAIWGLEIIQQAPDDAFVVRF